MLSTQAEGTGQRVAFVGARIPALVARVRAASAQVEVFQSAQGLLSSRAPGALDSVWTAEPAGPLRRSLEGRLGIGRPLVVQIGAGAGLEGDALTSAAPSEAELTSLLRLLERARGGMGGWRSGSRMRRSS